MNHAFDDTLLHRILALPPPPASPFAPAAPPGGVKNDGVSAFLRLPLPSRDTVL